VIKSNNTPIPNSLTECKKKNENMGLVLIVKAPSSLKELVWSMTDLLKINLQEKVEIEHAKQIDL
jgi:hypothetical protein